MTADPQLRDLVMQQLAARTGMPADTDPTAMLTKLAEQDPQVALLARHLAEQRSALVVDAEEDPEPEEPVAPERGSALRRIRRQVRALCAELEALRERNEALAAALGACRQCWGEDRACRRCGGAGASGWLTPDQVEYERYIVPVTNTERGDSTEGDGDAERLRRG